MALGLPGSKVGGFNWLFLVECVTVIIIFVFYLFYLNRIIAAIVAFLLNSLYGRASNSYFELSSLQISPLAGRIFFRDLRYHGPNQSIRVLSGTLTWRYWHFVVRQNENLQSHEQQRATHKAGPRSTNAKTGKPLPPCRITISLEGVEWFLYNRSTAYDDLYARFAKQDPATEKEWKAQNQAQEAVLPKEKPEKAKSDARLRIDRDAFDWLKETLPVYIQAKNGAIVLGNRSTPMTLIIGFKEASGVYGAVDLQPPIDKYRNVFNFRFTEIRSVFRTNSDHESTLADHGQQIEKWLLAQEYVSMHKSWTSQLETYHKFRKYLERLELNKRLVKHRQALWDDLARYKLDLESTAAAADFTEYAKVATLAETPALDLCYYADAAGKVQPTKASYVQDDGGLYDIGNNGPAPEWGVDVTLHGGIINYGPWTDRQRASFLSLFFPAVHFDQSPTPRLKAGDDRLHTALKIHVDFADPTIFRIPTREASKDWRYTESRDRADRKYGWFDVTVAAHTQLNQIIPMVAGPEGYESLIELNLVQPVVRTSATPVEDDPFLQAGKCRITFQMPSPLQWHDHRTWRINVAFERGETDDPCRVHLLRDHANLITDLVNDFVSGPPGEASLFVPTSYDINLQFRNYLVDLNLSKHNRIDSFDPKASDIWTIGGSLLAVSVQIPVTSFDSPMSAVTFNIEDHSIHMHMDFREGNPHAEQDAVNMRHFASADHLLISGSYTYFSKFMPQAVERLILNVNLDQVWLKAFGHIIDILLNVKDNYFGTFNHWQNRAEYDRKIAENEANLGDDVREAAFKGAKIPYEVLLSIVSKHNRILLNQDFYDASMISTLSFSELTVDLRSHDYFMELNIDSEPITVIGSQSLSLALTSEIRPQERDSALKIEGLSIRAYRAFGPQPKNNTYICSWHIGIGAIFGSLDMLALDGVSRAGSTFGQTFSQPQSLGGDSQPSPSDPDVTFVALRVPSVSVTLSTGQTTAIMISLANGISINMNDIPEPNFAKEVDVTLPDFSLQVLNLAAGSASDGTWLESARLATGLCVNLRRRPELWTLARRAKLSFLCEEDAKTQRLQFLLDKLTIRNKDLESASKRALADIYLPSLTDSVRTQRESMSVSSYSASISSSSSQVSVVKQATRGYQSDTDASDFTASAESLRGSIESDSPFISSACRTDSHYAKALRQLRTADFAKVETTFLSSQAAQSAGSDNFPEGESSRTHNCLFFSKATSVLVSPLAVQAFEDWLENMPKVLSSQRLLDSMVLLFAKDLPGKSSTSASETFEIHLPALRVQVIQHLESHSIASMFLSPFFKSVKTLESLSAGTGFADILLSDMRCDMEMQDKVICEAAISFDSLHLELATKLLLSGSDADKIVLTEMDVAHTTGSFHKAGDTLVFGLELGMCVAETALQTAEMLTSGILAWLGPLVHLKSIVDRLAVEDTDRKHYILLRLLDYTRLQTTLQPRFVQLHPLSVLQSPARRNILFIESLRYRLRFLPLTNEVSDILSDRKSLADALHQLALRADQLQSAFLLTDLMPNPTILDDLLGLQELPDASSAPFLANWPLRISLAAAGLTLRVVDRSSSQNKVLFTDLQAEFESQPTETLQPAIAVSFRLGLLDVSIDPFLPILVQHVADVREIFEDSYKAAVDATPMVEPSISTATRKLVGHMSFFCYKLVLSVDGSGIFLNIDSSNSFLDASIDCSDLEPFNGNLSVIISSDSLRFSSSEMVRHARNILNELEISKSCFVVQLASQKSDSHKARLFGQIGSFYFEAPQSLLRMHDFLQSWTRETFPQAQDTLKNLRRDMTGPRPLSAVTATPQPIQRGTMIERICPVLDLKVHGDLTSLKIKVHITTHVELEHEMAGISMFMETTMQAGKTSSLSAGLEVIEQHLRSNAKQPRQVSHEPTGMHLPPMRLCGNVSNISTQFVAAVEKISFNVDILFIDDILAIQTKLGQDLDALLSLGRQHLTGQQTASRNQIVLIENPAAVPLNVEFHLGGLQIGLDGSAATQYLEADAITGSWQRGAGVAWNAQVTGLALRLRARSAHLGHNKSHIHGNTLAFFRLDVTLSGHVALLNESAGNRLDINVLKVLAVMQAAAPKALVELYDHYSIEVNERKKSRQDEIELMRQRLQTIDMPRIQAATVPHVSLIDQCQLRVSVGHVGIALPLIGRQMDQLPSIGHNDSVSDAFLVSLESIQFDGKRSEGGSLRIHAFALSFVSAFDQAKDQHFRSSTHRTSNRLLLPSLAAAVNYDATQSNLTKVRIDASAGGLELDADPFMITLVYRLYLTLRTSSLDFARIVQENAASATTATSPIASRRRMTLWASLHVAPGRLHILQAKSHDSQISRPAHTRSQSGIPSTGHTKRDAPLSSLLTASLHQAGGLESFILPSFDARATYSGSDEWKGLDDINNATSDLLISMTLGSSENVLRPSLLSILQVAQAEFDKCLSRQAAMQATVARAKEEKASLSPTAFTEPASLRALHISVQLDIASSKLEIRSDKQVNLILVWQGGSFGLQTTPTAQTFSVLARTDEISVRLGHEWASQQRATFDLRARGLALSALLQQCGESEDHSHVFSIQWKLEEAKANVDMHYLHEWLSFYAVWFHRAPKPNDLHLRSPSQMPDSTSVPELTDEANSVQHRVLTLVVAQIDRVTATMQVGSTQSVDAELIHWTTFLKTGGGRDVDREFHSSHEGITANLINTNLLSTIKMQDMQWRTKLRYLTDSRDVPNDSLADIRIRVGTLHFSTMRRDKRLLLIRNEPIDIRAMDDWRLALRPKDPSFKIDLGVTLGGLFVFATPDAVPQLLHQIQGFVNLIEQGRRKATDALSPGVQQRHSAAGDLISTVAERMKTEGSTLDCHRTLITILRLDLKRFHICIFGQSFSNSPIYVADVFGISVDLVRNLKYAGPIERDFTFKVRRAAAFKLAPLQIKSEEERDLTVDSMLAICEGRRNRPILVDFPSMIAQVQSTETGRERRHRTYVGPDDAFAVASSSLSVAEWIEFRDIGMEYVKHVKTAIRGADQTHLPQERKGNDATAPIPAAGQHRNGSIIAIPIEPAVVRLPKYELAGEGSDMLFDAFLTPRLRLAPTVLNEEITDGLEAISSTIVRYYRVQLQRRLAN